MSLVKLTLIFLVAHLAAALFFLLDRAPGTAAALAGLPLDDAWIHMVYARSLAALHGFAYNPGQLETGSTSPLWAVLLVPATWVAQLFGASVVIPAKVTGVLCAVGASVGAARLVRALGFGLAAELASGLALAVGILAEHGLAYWIEWDGQKALFDTGQGNVLARGGADAPVAGGPGRGEPRFRRGDRVGGQ